MKVHSQSIKKYQVSNRKFEKLTFPNSFKGVKTTASRDLIVMLDNMSDSLKVCDPNLNLLGVCQGLEKEIDEYERADISETIGKPKNRIGPISVTETLHSKIGGFSGFTTLILDFCCSERHCEVPILYYSRYTALRTTKT